LFQLSFASDRVFDGLGAQIQRQLSIEAFANFLNVIYIPTPLRHIAIHPLDDFQSTSEMEVFLDKVNSLFEFDTKSPVTFEITHELSKLTILRLLVIVFELRIRRKAVHLCVSEVYDIVDFLPDFYNGRISSKRKLNDFCNLGSSSEFVCIHYRQGVGGKVVYPGQKIPRELDITYFVGILSRLDLHGKRVFVITDAPQSTLIYRPITDQRYLWDGTPKFNNGEMSISGFDLTEAFRMNGFDVEVVSGGDLIEALKLMLTCNILIMSRSSLSYSAAILNKEATIYYPPGFWHPPMRDWKS
jgi:hypothetical protein